MNIRPQYHFRHTDRGLFAWDVRKLCQLASRLTPKHILLTEIQELDESFWYDIGPYKPTCRSMAEHMRLVQQVDLQYPIILCKEGRVMDGMHRVCRALLEGHETILAVQFSEDIAPDYVGKGPDEVPYD